MAFLLIQVDKLKWIPVDCTATSDMLNGMEIKQ